MGIYATVAEVRAEPEVADAAPPSDAVVEALIVQAEDRIDEWLGPWPILATGPSTGRKIAQADVEAWQWAKVKRAVVRLAAQLHANPKVLLVPEFEEEAGPDFRVKRSQGASSSSVAVRIPDVAAPLNASGLRLRTARVA